MAIAAGGVAIARALALPQTSRCMAAACAVGDILFEVTLSQACTPLIHDLKGTDPAGSQLGPSILFPSELKLRLLGQSSCAPRNIAAINEETIKKVVPAQMIWMCDLRRFTFPRNTPC